MSMPELLAASVKKTAWMLSRMTFAPLNPKLRFETPPLILHPGADLLDGLARVDEVDAVRVVLLDACVDIPYVYMYVYGAVPRARRAPTWSRGLGL